MSVIFAETTASIAAGNSHDISSIFSYKSCPCRHQVMMSVKRALQTGDCSRRLFWLSILCFRFWLYDFCAMMCLLKVVITWEILSCRFTKHYCVSKTLDQGMLEYAPLLDNRHLSYDNIVDFRQIGRFLKYILFVFCVKCLFA